MSELRRRFHAYIDVSDGGSDVAVKDNVHDATALVLLPKYEDRAEDAKAKEDWMREFNGLSDNMQHFIWECIA